MINTETEEVHKINIRDIGVKELPVLGAILIKSPMWETQISLFQKFLPVISLIAKYCKISYYNTKTILKQSCELIFHKSLCSFKRYHTIRTNGD